MSYTTTDLENIDQAIKDMAAGTRVGEFQHNGRRIKYAEVTMDDLRDLRRQVAASLTRPRSRFTQIVTDKGL